MMTNYPLEKELSINYTRLESPFHRNVQYAQYPLETMYILYIIHINTSKCIVFCAPLILFGGALETNIKSKEVTLCIIVKVHKTVRRFFHCVCNAQNFNTLETHSKVLHADLMAPYLCSMILFFE